MAKSDTDKEIQALRFPIDVDVTDDIVKKRLALSKTIESCLNCCSGWITSRWVFLHQMMA